MRYKYTAMIIIEASIQSACNGVAKQYLDAAGGEKSFTAGLSAGGESPATHYVAHTSMTEGGVGTLLTFYGVFFPKFRLWISGPSSGVASFRDKENVVVGPFNAHEVLEEIGLKQINDT